MPLYNTSLENSDLVWQNAEKILKIGLFLAELWLFEVAKGSWRHNSLGSDAADGADQNTKFLNHNFL